MNVEHTDALFEAAPILYCGKKKPLTESLMAFGFECEGGWFYPLLELSENLEGLNTLTKKYGVWIEATQVKEKFGTLHFYYDTRCRLSWWRRLVNWVCYPIIRLTWKKNGKFHWLGLSESQDQRSIIRFVTNQADHLINKCEADCENHCEFCGLQFGSWNKDKKVVTKGWISIICKDCADKRHLKY